ncbi:MAG TPA: recombinase family protein [Gaiellaceae bacterium]|jgi:DNA invertase Pin-like site-specific DNA recombinase|nr:recombinase family protein [Gaiellaceae bacterium]
MPRNRTPEDYLRRRSKNGIATVAPEDRPQLPIDRIVRVSSKGERVVSSESYLTERQQMEAIDLELKKKKLPPGELYVSRDESGHAWEDQRANLAEALRRIREGESGGIIVAYFSRFARTAPEALTAIREIHKAGAIFISAEDNLDSSTEMGRMTLSIMAIIAEMQWNQLAKGWRSTVSMVIGDGRYITGAVPVGYLMGDDGRLTPDARKVGPNGETAAELIAELFRLRAEEQVSWTKLADWLTEMGVRPPAADMTERKVEDRPARAERYGPDGWKRWSPSSIQGIIANVAYLGWARAVFEEGEPVINKTAHEPLVPETTWLAAQQARGTNGGRSGEMSDRCLLKSKAICETCGHTLLITGRWDNRRGERLPLYYCRGRYSDGTCEGKGIIDAAKLDGYIERLFLEEIAPKIGVRKVGKNDQKRIREVEEQLDEAETALTYFLSNTGKLLKTLGAKRYEAELERLQGELDAAQEELEGLRARRDVVLQIDKGTLKKVWPKMTPVQKRRVILPLLESVAVKPANGKKGRGAPPVEERAVVNWVTALN